jgi:hypothetical protein
VPIEFQREGVYGVPTPSETCIIHNVGQFFIYLGATIGFFIFSNFPLQLLNVLNYGSFIPFIETLGKPLGFSLYWNWPKRTTIEL